MLVSGQEGRPEKGEKQRRALWVTGTYVLPLLVLPGPSGSVKFDQHMFRLQSTKRKVRVTPSDNPRMHACVHTIKREMHAYMHMTKSTVRAGAHVVRMLYAVLTFGGTSSWMMTSSLVCLDSKYSNADKSQA